MDPKEIIPENTTPNGTPSLSELFAQTEEVAPIVEAVAVSNDSVATTTPVIPVVENIVSDIPEVVTSPEVIVAPVTESLPVAETTSQSTKPDMDPKLLAGNLEEKWSDESTPSQQLLQQQVSSSNDSQVQVVEKVVYEQPRVHGFFRTLTLIALLLIGVLMLLEELKVFSLNLGGWFDMNIFYPVFVILSVIVIWSYKGIFGKIFGLLMFLSVVGGSFILGVYSSLNPATTNATGTDFKVLGHSNTPYSKIYVSTIVNGLTVVPSTGNGLLSAQYDIGRPLTLLSGMVTSGHDYVMIKESDNVNLLQGVYSRLNVGISPQQPLYLYVKTFLGQDILNLSQLNIRGLRVHGGVLSLDITVGSDGNIQVQPTAFSSGSNLNTGSIMTGMAYTGKQLQPKIIDLDIQAAVADVTLHLPKDMGIRMQYKSYLGKMDAPGLSKNPQGVYESLDIQDAKTILDINALFGLSRLTIVQDR